MTSVVSDQQSIHHTDLTPADELVLLVPDPKPHRPGVRVRRDEAAGRPDLSASCLLWPGNPPGCEVRMFGLYDWSESSPEDHTPERLAAFPPTPEEALVIGLEADGFAVTMARTSSEDGWELRIHGSAEAAHEYFGEPAPLTLHYFPQPTGVGQWR